MSRFTFNIVILALVLLMAGPRLVKAEPRFRNPINVYKSPPVSSYFDDRAGSGIISWRCDASTYDGHTGTDFRADIGIAVWAGASGALYERWDACPTWGYKGDSCGGYYGNHVRIAHSYPYNASSSWITLYGHLSQGTANVRGYSSLNCSAWVGYSGSSGSSTGPHVHFETRSYGNPRDPFAGSCSGPTSFWVNQNGGLPTTQCQ